MQLQMSIQKVIAPKVSTALKEMYEGKFNKTIKQYKVPASLRFTHWICLLKSYHLQSGFQF